MSVLRGPLLLGAALLPMLLAPAQAQIKLRPPPPASAPAPPTQMLLQADQVVYDGDNQIVSAVGNVEIDDQGRILHADTVTYDQKTDQVTANGHVNTLDINGNVAFADHVVLKNRMRDGVLDGFGALIGKNGRLAAASAQRVGGTMVIAHQTAYSPCKICNQPGKRMPVWQVKAEKVVYDQVKHRIHFSDATVDFLGVPIVYTPYLSEPDPSVHYASGLLAPDLGTATRIGQFARVPVYIALSPTNDLTLQPMVSTEGGEMLEGEYRARWNNSGMWIQASDTYNPNGGLGNGAGAQDYDHLFGTGRFMLDDTWRTGFDAQLTNNSGYMRLYDISNLDRLVNDIFVEDDTGRSRLAVSSYYFQGLRSTDAVSRIPYALPLLEYSFIPNHNVLGGQFKLDLSGVALSRGTGRDDQRLTAETSWSKPVIMAGGQVWTFTLDGRGDAFRLETPAVGSTPGSTTSLSRGTGYAELDWRWPFMAAGGGSRSYLLEPIGQVIAQPYGGNPTGLRDEDSSDFELSENDIFSVSQVPGYDLLESGPRANVGFRAEAMFASGEAEAIVGQTYRLKSDPIFAQDSGESGTASDVVGRLSIKFPHLDFTDRFDLDRGDGTLRRHEVYVTGTYGRSSLQISYLELPAETATLGLGNREQVNAQGDVNFYDNWQGFVAISRDLLANQFLDTEYGLGYEDECLAISLAYRRKFTSDVQLGLPPSSSWILRFSLKTGDQPVQPFSLFPQNVFTSSHP